MRKTTMTTEWIILADYVEFTCGKLYMMGGGWERLTINHPGRIHNFGIAAAFRAEKNDGDTPSDVTITIKAANATNPVIEIQALLELEPARDQIDGQSQLAQLALNLNVEFEVAGRYDLIASIDGHESRRHPFWVGFGERFDE
jgi:hypothetical protein